MWRVEGPSGLLWRDTEMGMEGFRYFIRGSMSRQNFLFFGGIWLIGIFISVSSTWGKNKCWVFFFLLLPFLFLMLGVSVCKVELWRDYYFPNV
jgi:hypothetical protein